jgi:hypothetical protein
MKKLKIFVFIVAINFLFLHKTYADYVSSQRSVGPIMVNEVLFNGPLMVVNVASGGCTDNQSFKLEATKQDSSGVPFYTITIKRVKADTCKALIDGGVYLVFDVAKDLGLNGKFYYKLANPILPIANNNENSLLSVIKNHYDFKPNLPKETKPQPFSSFTMTNNYFSCLIPTNWELIRDQDSDVKTGIYDIKLIKQEKTENNGITALPEALIYIGYYTKNNTQKKTYESYLSDYQKLLEKHQKSTKSKYEKPISTSINGMPANQINYEVYQEITHGPIVVEKYFLVAKFILVKSKEGFFILAYKAPKKLYNEYLPVFDEVVKSFKVTN